MGRRFAICPFCGCGCGMYLEVVGEQMFAVLPSQVHPAGAGRLCLRGWQAGGLIESNRRLLRPQIGQQDASWEAATGAAADSLKSVLQEGPQAIGVLCGGHLTNEEAFACRLYSTEALGTPNLDSSARAVDAGSIWGLEQTFCMPYRSPVLSEIANSDVILCLNSNLSWESPQAAGYIMEAAEAGATVIVIDEVDQGLRDLAALYVRHKLGARGALLHLLVESVAGSGGLDADGRNTLEQTGVELETFREVCLLLRAAKRLGIVFSTTALQIPEEAAHLAELAMLREASGAEAANVFALRSDCNSVGVTDMGIAPVREGEIRGLSTFEMLTSEGHLRGLVVFAEAVEKFIGEGQLQRLREQLEFLLCVGCFETATSQLADVVLPMAGWGECEGTFTCHDGTIWPLPKVASPPGESRELAQILRDLSATQVPPALAADIMALRAQISQHVPGYGPVDWQQVTSGQPAAAVPALGNDTQDLVGPAREIPELAGTSPERPHALVVRHDEGSWAFDARARGAEILARELADQRTPFVVINPETCRQLETREGRSISISTTFGSEVLPIRCSAGVPGDVVMLPWQFRDIAQALAGPVHLDTRTGSAHHLPVAASLEIPTGT